MNVVSNTTLATHCFNSCEDCNLTGPPKKIAVTFRINMNNMIAQFGKIDTCYVAGSFQGWSPGKEKNALTDPDGDGIYEGQDSVDENSTYEFKYLYGSEWGYDETGLAGLSCATGGGNRRLEAGDSDTTLIAYCFNTCDDDCAVLPDKIKVRFKVDLSSEVPSADGVWMKSSFQWPQFRHEVIELTLIDPVNGIFGTDYLDIVPIRQNFFFVNGITDPDQENAKFADLGCGIINTVGAQLRTVNLTGVTEPQDLGYVWNTCDKLTGTKNEELKVNLTVQPNPFDHSTTIKFDNIRGEQYQLHILNVLGLRVKEINNIESGEILLHRDQLNSGVYIISLKNTKGSITNKRIVIK